MYQNYCKFIICFVLFVYCSCQKKQIHQKSTFESRILTSITSHPATQIFEVDEFLMDTLHIKIIKQRNTVLKKDNYQGRIFLKSEKTGNIQWEKNVEVIFKNGIALIAETIQLSNPEGDFLLEFYLKHESGEDWLFANNHFSLRYFLKKIPFDTAGPSKLNQNFVFEFGFPKPIASGTYPVTFTFNKSVFNAVLEIDADKMGKLSFKVPLKNYADGVYPLQLKIFLPDRAIVWENKKFLLRKYTIYTWQDLQAMEEDLSANYILGSDIYMPEPAAYPNNGQLGIRGFRPIGLCDGFTETQEFNAHQVVVNVAEPTKNPYTNGKAFTGTLDGKGFTIYDLFIDAARWNGVGLFGVIDGADAAIRNLNIQVNYIEGKNLVGALAGFVRTGKGIKNVSISGIKKNDTGAVNIRGTNYVGGLIGWMGYKSHKHTATLQGITIHHTIVGGTSIVGGAIGFSAASLYDSKARALLGATSNYLGGLVGVAEDIYIQNSFVASEKIVGQNYVGGLVGYLSGNSAVFGAYFDHTLDNTTAILEGKSHVAGLIAVVHNVPDYFLNEVYVVSHTGRIITTDQKGTQDWICQDEQYKPYITSAFVNGTRKGHVFKEPQRVLLIEDITPDKENKLKSIGFSFPTRWKFVPNVIYPRLSWQ